MPAPISAAQKQEFARLWNASKTLLAKLANLMPVSPEKASLAFATAAVDNALADWRAGKLDDASFTQLYKRISDANLAIGDLAKKRQAIGISDAVDDYQAALDNDLNPIVMAFWDVKPIVVTAGKKSNVGLIVAVVATFAIIGIVISRSKE